MKVYSVYVCCGTRWICTGNEQHFTIHCMYTVHIRQDYCITISYGYAMRMFFSWKHSKNKLNAQCIWCSEIYQHCVVMWWCDDASFPSASYECKVESWKIWMIATTKTVYTKYQNWDSRKKKTETKNRRKSFCVLYLSHNHAPIEMKTYSNGINSTEDIKIFYRKLRLKFH